MIDIGWQELIVVCIVLVLVVGPKDLPRVLFSFGQWMGRLRRMVHDLQYQMNAAAREVQVATEPVVPNPAILTPPPAPSSSSSPSSSLDDNQSKNRQDIPAAAQDEKIDKKIDKKVSAKKTPKRKASKGKILLKKAAKKTEIKSKKQTTSDSSDKQTKEVT